MKVNRLQGLRGAAGATGVAIIVDVFRACTTACHGLSRRPSNYWLAGSCVAASRIAMASTDPLIVGKPEPGSALPYDIPNSPTRMDAVEVEGRVVIHRTAAGARGVVVAENSDATLLGSFANAAATVARIAALRPTVVSIVAMGHEGNTASLEDDLCADYLQARLRGLTVDINPFLPTLLATTGAYFVGDAQSEYPRSDFAHCLELDRFDFAIEASRVGDSARIWPTWPAPVPTGRPRPPWAG